MTDMSMGTPNGASDDPISWWMCGVRGGGGDIVLRCHAMATTAGPLYTRQTLEL